MVIYDSPLCSTGNEATAEGFLSDVVRNVSAFGLTLVPLDIRQESDRHEEALDCITRHLGIGSYTEWDEDTKINWLVQQLGSKRPLIRAGVWDENPEIFTPSAADTLGIFEMIAEQHEGSLGAYVISQATTASDVLAVYVLQKDAGVKKPLRVAPLFETLEDLKGATGTMESLFSLPTYMGIIQGSQEIMIGYSDSAKDAGRLAASWSQYETQEMLAELAKKHDVDVTFFHGKGGTVGRGGNPATFKAILAHAPDTINGRFRVTEQGEMINQNFGHGDRAERTMDIYTAAVLAEKLTERPKPNDEWRYMMNKLSDISCDAYRKIVREDERFVPYFRSATPELELSKLNIGSRPAKRKAGGGVESLRAIPWNFAWTQTRLNLPTWLGVGEAVGEVLASDEGDKLRDMYRDFESFRTTIDLVEMVLAKSEPSIARHYDNMLVEDEKAQELGAEVRSMHVATENAVLDLTNHTSLSEGKTMLTRALQVRNPYVDCLNVLQAETLKRLRETEEGKEDTGLNDALLTTITGIANGMGSTRS
jgi:phosphoenolpyruvate carboxylase